MENLEVAVHNIQEYVKQQEKKVSVLRRHSISLINWVFLYPS
ncbi:hypothetical protein [Collibacillus ludicampi]|nr:hypothetical protein [Collibacillus ludicampi]